MAPKRRKGTVTGLLALFVVAGAGCDPPDEEENLPPLALNTIPDTTMLIGETATVTSIDRYFGDPDGDELSYSAKSASAAVTVSLAGTELTITGVDEANSVAVTVTATDPGGLSARQRFRVTVEPPNQAPIVVEPFDSVELAVGRFTEVMNIGENFHDPDGDSLTFSAASNDTEVVTARASGELLTIRARRVGTATITVTATDPEGLSAGTDFHVTVIEDGSEDND